MFRDCRAALSHGTRNQQCQRLFVLCYSAIARALRPVHKDYDAVAGLALPQSSRWAFAASAAWYLA